MNKDLIKNIIAKIFFIKQKKYLVLPSKIRWGNILYFFLYAYTNQLKIIPRDGDLEYWTNIFPQFKDLIISEKDIKKMDVQKHYSGYLQFAKEDFQLKDLEYFVKDNFLKDNNILQYLEKTDPEALYINIRRGDFYSPQHIDLYGFNIPEFLKHFFEKVCVVFPKKIIIISDDINWCKSHLQFLCNYNTTVYFAADLNAETSFLTLATAKNLLVSNSTFCYWAAYVSTYLYGEESKIYAPSFVSRHDKHKDHKQLLDTWTIIKDFDYNLPFN